MRGQRVWTNLSLICVSILKYGKDYIKLKSTNINISSVLVESHEACPDDGVCTSEYCNRVSDLKGAKVVKHFRENKCQNKFNIKSWGCKHPEIKNKELIRISLGTKKEEVRPTSPVIPIASVTRIDLRSFIYAFYVIYVCYIACRS